MAKTVALLDSFSFVTFQPTNTVNANDFRAVLIDSNGSGLWVHGTKLELYDADGPIHSVPLTWGAGQKITCLVRNRHVIVVGPKWEHRCMQRCARKARRRIKRRRGW